MMFAAYNNHKVKKNQAAIYRIQLIKITVMSIKYETKVA